jgi:hypothetical protein
MPQILVISDAKARDSVVTLCERVNVEDFASPHFGRQLVERLGWAVGDAVALERDVWDEAGAQRAERPALADSLAERVLSLAG